MEEVRGTAAVQATVSLLLALAGCGSDSAKSQEAPLPFEVTEERPRCSHYDPYRQAFFGTTHLHTGLSFDASIRFVDYASGNDPRGAYRFAKGESSIQLPDPLGLQGPEPLRNPHIDLPTDWGAVTDHSEHFGAVGICKDFLGMDAPGRLSMECRMINGFYYQPASRSPSNLLDRTLASNAFTQLTMSSLGTSALNTHLPFCESGEADCTGAELAVWEEMQNAAEEEYDRTSDCTFTTFVGYENTSTPLGQNWHRNVIFRNDRVVRQPITAIDMAAELAESPTTGGPDGVGQPPSWLGGTVRDSGALPVPPGTEVRHPLPQRLWNRLERECTFGENITDGAATRCDFITIPHNSNLGGGGPLTPPMFLDPFNREDARRHAEMEPLVEIYQDKGSSECRFDPRFDRGTDTVDEFCNFELLDSGSLMSASGVGGGDEGALDAPEDFGERSYVRNVWKEGLRQAQEEWAGINPFKMGVVASSDSHTGVMGWHPENEDWPGHLGIDDAWPMQRPSTIQNSSGGHSVVWAEENSRDSIFEALERKETYGTSGTRIIVRFFGGWDFDPGLCETNFVPFAYENGVPMGGDLAAPPSSESLPRFIAAAWKDDFIGTNLEQIQIIKGWVTADGEKMERVYRIVGEEGNARNPEVGVEIDTCATKEGGAERLCQVWEDPDFDPSQRAFYYVRVVEKPVCRYSTHWCRERIGVDPLDLDQCRTDLQAMAESDSALQQLNAERGAACCSDQTTFPIVQPVIQERAWTSPIWYEPDA